jgi:hypothetical protein
MIKSFIDDVLWGEIDYLIIDTPPGLESYCLHEILCFSGTSDEHISIVESLQQYHPDGAIIVTTPQALYQTSEMRVYLILGDFHFGCTERDHILPHNRITCDWNN